MSAKILVNRFCEKNFAVEYQGWHLLKAEWNRDTGLSLSMPSGNPRKSHYTKHYLEPEEAEAFSKWLNDCLSE